jgi:hypothetical protein
MIDAVLRLLSAFLIAIGIIGLIVIYAAIATEHANGVDVCQFRHWGYCADQRE